MSTFADVCSGYFINLDRSVDRRARLEAQLSELGLDGIYRRFPAVDGSKLARGRSPLKPGEIALFRSHLEVIERSLASSKFVHILEDDVVISPTMASELLHAITIGLFDAIDIVLTDTFVPFQLEIMRQMMHDYRRAKKSRPPRQTRLLEMAKFNMAGTTSYLINPRSLLKVRAVLKNCLNNGPALPIDLALRVAADTGVLHIACLFPFLTTTTFAPSTITQHDDTLAVRLLELLRYSFFIDADLAGEAWTILNSLPEQEKPHSDPQRCTFLKQIAELVLSDQFKPI